LVSVMVSSQGPGSIVLRGQIGGEILRSRVEWNFQDAPFIRPSDESPVVVRQLQVANSTSY